MATATQPNYRYAGIYDPVVFQAEFTQQFARNGRYNTAAVPPMLTLLGLIQSDPAIIDVRWAAYMLATVMWETTVPTTTTRQATNKKGKPLVDKKGQPVMVKQRRWLMSMSPVDEIGHGKGRHYHEPVKVKLLTDGSVRVTEQDGDQFSISASGVIKALTKGAVMGTKDGGAAVNAYDKDDGTEHAYFGRGYVQLTWWSNYALSSIAIGQELYLLLDPELVKTPEIAYALMSHGMNTGKGFANGHRFVDYFSAARTDYVSARKMVNGHDHAADIAALAVQFEALLLKARLATPAATTL
jgi:hypothetical protein